MKPINIILLTLSVAIVGTVIYVLARKPAVQTELRDTGKDIQRGTRDMLNGAKDATEDVKDAVKDAAR